MQLGSTRRHAVLVALASLLAGASCQPERDATVDYDFSTELAIRNPILAARAPVALESAKLGSIDDLTRPPDPVPTEGDGVSVVPAEDRWTWPARANVQLFNKWGVTAEGVTDEGLTDEGLCSGALIDTRHVLTAGHCVHSEDHGWADRVSIWEPEHGGEIARSLGVRSFTGWTDYGNLGYDLAIVYLDRPIGATVGSLGYGPISCSDTTHTFLEQYSFPGEGPFAGLMVYWNGFKISCTGHTVLSNEESWKGQSGSVFYSGGDADPVARLVRSGTSAASSREIRIWQGAFDTFHEYVHGHRGGAFDLTPVADWRAENPAPVMAGEPLVVADTLIHNYSDAPFSGELTVTLYLSENESISPSDTELWRHTGHHAIPAMGSLWFGPGSVTIPASVGPDLVAKTYFLGALVTTPGGDARPENDGGTRHDATEILVTARGTDLEAVSLVPQLGTYLNSQLLPVEFTVENVGALDTGAWTGDFFLLPADEEDDGDPIPIGSGGATPLEVGQSYNDTVELSLAGVPPGSYRVRLTASEPDEIDPSNNTIQWQGEPIEIVGDPGDLYLAPDLEALYVATPALGVPYGPSDAIPVAFSVANDGAGVGGWDAHFWAVSSTGQVVYLAHGSSGALASGADYAGVVDVPLAGLGAGIWRIVLQVGCDVPEQSTANNTAVAATTFEIEIGLTGP